LVATGRPGFALGVLVAFRTKGTGGVREVADDANRHVLGCTSVIGRKVPFVHRPQDSFGCRMRLTCSSSVKVVKPSGKGRTATWDGMVGTVVRFEGASVFVQWHNVAVEDERDCEELVSTGTSQKRVRNTQVSGSPFVRCLNGGRYGW
jgi:hypothetical protein